MTEKILKGPVMVSGGSGYLASHIIKQLLEEGYRVHATVRDLSAREKYEHLENMAVSLSGEITMFEADLLKPGSFTGAMKGCTHVFHTASPFTINKPKDPQAELVDPAVKGTENILHTVNETGTVERVILTSSLAAIMGDHMDAENIAGGIFTEEIWNTTSNLSHQPYSYSKTLAEKKAWEMANAQSRWSLVVMNPGFILGPSLTNRTDSVSINFMVSMGKGTYKTGAPEGYMAVVDVRDVARAHILGAFKKEASGRHILSSEIMSFMDIAQMLKKEFPEYPIPTRKVPKWLFLIIGPMFGLSRKYIRRNIGISLDVDNSYSIMDLSLQYRPARETLKDHFQQLIDNGLV